MTLVTHDGLCHTDDVACIALLTIIFPTSVVVRTRNIDALIEYSNDPEAIVFDVGNGELDHHATDDVVDGRALSAIGKVWRKYRELIMSLYEIDEQSWWDIDELFVKPIDISDNTGVLNPLNYAFNAMRKGPNDPIDSLINWMKGLWIEILGSEYTKTLSRKEYEALPETILDGKLFKFNDSDKFVGCSGNDPRYYGIIFKSKNGYMVKPFNGNTLSKKAVVEGDIPGVVFTHKGGWLGEIRTLDALKAIL